MQGKVQKWGNSLGVRIPKHLADEAGLREQSEIEFSLVKGALVVRPVRRPALALDSLLEGVSESNLHGEELAGPAVGRESW
jgi:antitoxin MazE